MGALPTRAASMLAFTFLVFAAACSSMSSPVTADDVGGAWSAGPALPLARFEAYGATLGEKVYFVGGITGVLGDIATAEPSRRIDVYDPAARAWSAGPDLPADAPKHHLSVTTWNGALYVLGGFDGIIDQHPNEPFRPIAVAYLLENGAWKRLATPPLARGAATAQAIDGKIYLTGGAPNEGTAPFAKLDIYDIATDTWSAGASMPTAREHLASCALDGRFVVVGGWASVAGVDVAQTAVESYDPQADQWTALAPLPTARGGLGATARGSACHVVGGEDWALPFPGTFGTHEVFDGATGTWQTGVPMPTARHGFGLTWLDDQLFAVGGGPSQGNSYTAAVEILSP